MSYTASESSLSRQYYHTDYLPYQTQHATGHSSTQRPRSGPSSAPDPATFDFPSGTSKFDCPWCDKSYTGPNGRSVWRRHAQEKHNLPCNSRRSRWDTNIVRPKNTEDKKDRNLACKRQWAKDNRIKKRLLKQLSTISPSNPNRNKIEADLVEWANRRRSQSVEKENTERSVQRVTNISTPVFAPLDSRSMANNSYEYTSDLSSWSTASQESSLPCLDVFDRSMVQSTGSYEILQDEGVGVLRPYVTASAASLSPPMSYSKPASSQDEGDYSDEEADEMMQFMERYSSVEPTNEIDVSLDLNKDSESNDSSERLASLSPTVMNPSLKEKRGHDDCELAHLGLLPPYSMDEEVINRRAQAIWKRAQEQEEAEDETKVEESLFTPLPVEDDEEYGFHSSTRGQPSSPVSAAETSLDSSFDSVKLVMNGPAATPRFPRLAKILESPFHLKPVETTPDKRRLAWELGLGAESSPGSGFYLAQVKSAVAGCWVEEF